jgi:hypothetical protein
VAGFADAWEYDDEDEDNMFEDEFAEVDEPIRRTSERISGGKSRTVGVSIRKEDKCDTDWRRDCDWKRSQV